MIKPAPSACLAATLLTLVACNQKAETGGDPAKPQAALAAPGSGGRNAPSGAAASPAAAPAAATPEQAIDFGDDASKFARDGECDDKRFSGQGMTNTPLLDSDVGHDATDCRAAFKQGRLTLGPAAPASAAPGLSAAIERIQWGDDNGKFARDGECDDKRFTGPGMTSTPLLDSDIQHDATDCRSAFAQGRLSLRE
jgi:hypothetical protein